MKDIESIAGGMDHMGQDLLKSMLKLNPEKRITCREILKHP